MTKLEFLNKQLDRLTLANVMAMTLLAALIGFGLLVFLRKPPDGADKNNMTLVLMAFSTGVGTVIGWQFGSSQMSGKKTDAILKALPGTGDGAQVNTTIVNQPKE